jgi:hypothetical protein
VHYSGAINQSRSNTCPSEDMGAWVTTSDNCTPDPPTCNYSVQEEQRSCGQNQVGSVTYKREQNCPDPYGNPVDSGWFEIRRDCSPAPATCATSTLQRTLSCSDGYTGSITQQQTSSCPDQYGQPIFGAWEEIQNSCVKSVTNPTNVSSPVSPISPINPMAAPAPPVAEAPPPAPVEMQVEAPPPPAAAPPPTAAPKSEVSSSATTSSSPTATKTETKTETKVETKAESKQETPQKIEVPKGKELVGGFGLVMSLELLNNPITFQQQQLEIALDYSQELPYELRGSQGVLLQFITESNIADAFNNIASDRWKRLFRNYEVQPSY